MSPRPLIDELRDLIVRAAPDPAQAAPVADCAPDVPLDEVIPFSSVIVLGAVIAVEDRYGVRVTKSALADACVGGVTLRKLAEMVADLREAPAA